MLEFAARHGVTPQTEHFPMSRINEAFQRLEAGKARYRIVLDADSKEDLAKHCAELDAMGRHRGVGRIGGTRRRSVPTALTKAALKATHQRVPAEVKGDQAVTSFLETPGHRISGPVSGPTQRLLCGDPLMLVQPGTSSCSGKAVRVWTLSAQPRPTSVALRLKGEWDLFLVEHGICGFLNAAQAYGPFVPFKLVFSPPNFFPAQPAACEE